MQRPKYTVLIVGGGIAGLSAARLLHRARMDFLLLEARDRLGGRILSVDATGAPSADGFDLGPSWFWPGMQRAMDDLVRDLGLSVFPQNSEGDVVFHRMSREAPQRYQGTGQNAPQSMRLAGGTGSLVTTLAAALPQDRIRLGARVTRVTLDENGTSVAVTFGDVEEIVRASHVLFALPPRLLEATVAFLPPLDPATATRWRDAATWMAPHAKVFALYGRPFWREAGLSGTAQSMVGPLLEIHDATTASGQAALFGFVGASAGQRAAIGRDALVAACLKQLAHLFGPEAEVPTATLFKDWATDPLTATADDQVGGGHPVDSGQPWIGGVWQGHIFLAGSETAVNEPGYLAGALDAAERAVAAIVDGRRP